MEFVKVNIPVGLGIRIIHCKECDCDENKTQDASLSNAVSKSTGG